MLMVVVQDSVSLLCIRGETSQILKDKVVLRVKTFSHKIKPMEVTFFKTPCKDKVVEVVQQIIGSSKGKALASKTFEEAIHRVIKGKLTSQKSKAIPARCSPNKPASWETLCPILRTFNKTCSQRGRARLKREGRDRDRIQHHHRAVSLHHSNYNQVFKTLSEEILKISQEQISCQILTSKARYK